MGTTNTWSGFDRIDTFRFAVLIYIHCTARGEKSTADMLMLYIITIVCHENLKNNCCPYCSDFKHKKKTQDTFCF